MTGSSVPSMKQSLPRRFCLETWDKALWVKEKLKIQCYLSQRATDFLNNIQKWNKSTMRPVQCCFPNLFWVAEIYFCHHNNTWICTILSCSQKGLTVEKLRFWQVAPFCKVLKDVLYLWRHCSKESWAFFCSVSKKHFQLRLSEIKTLEEYFILIIFCVPLPQISYASVVFCAQMFWCSNGKLKHCLRAGGWVESPVWSFCFKEESNCVLNNELNKYLVNI